MFGIVPKITDKELSVADFATWAALCFHAKWERDVKGNPTKSLPGSCFPSLALLQEEAHLGSHATLVKALNHLESLGYLRRESGGYSKKGKKNNQYTLFTETYREILSDLDEEIIVTRNYTDEELAEIARFEAMYPQIHIS